MQEPTSRKAAFSVWRRRSVLLVFVSGMIGLIFMSVQAYRYAPPIPQRVVDSQCFHRGTLTVQEI
jgi:nitric oxide reductase subunit B